MEKLVEYHPFITFVHLVKQNESDFDTNCRKKETSDTLTTRRSNKLNQFLQKEPWWRKAPWTVIC